MERRAEGNAALRTSDPAVHNHAYGAAGYGARTLRPGFADSQLSPKGGLP